MKSGEGRGQIDVLTLIFPVFVPAAVASTVQSQSNTAYRLQAVVELNRTILGETESMRINSSSASNRTDRELECTIVGSFPVYGEVTAKRV